MERSVVLCGRRIRYELERKNVKNVNLRIRADGSVHVSASRRVPLAFVEAFLQSKAAYITGAIDRFAAMEQARSRERITGGSVLLLGQSLSLTVYQSDKNRVALDGKGIGLFVTDPEDGELKERTLEKWRRPICEETVTALCRQVYPHFERRGIAFPELRFRKMKSRWGSCRPQEGVLTFNTALIRTPVDCIEYVVCHEFTHFLQPNHSPAFYDALSETIPDWKARREKLKAYM